MSAEQDFDAALAELSRMRGLFHGPRTAGKLRRLLHGCNVAGASLVAVHEQLLATTPARDPLDAAADHRPGANVLTFANAVRKPGAKR